MFCQLHQPSWLNLGNLSDVNVLVCVGDVMKQQPLRAGSKASYDGQRVNVHGNVTSHSPIPEE